MNTTEMVVSEHITRIFKVDNPEQAHLITCNFCEKTLQEVGQLFSGKTANACPECMVLAHQVIAEDLAEEKK